KPPQPPRSTLFPYTTLFRSEHIQMVFLKDEDPAQRDRHVKRGGVEIVLRVDARLDLDEGADVVIVHVIDADDGRDALKVIGDGRDRKSTRLNSSHRTISYAV